MNGNTLYISIDSLNKLSLTDIRDFFRCLRHLGLPDKERALLFERYSKMTITQTKDKKI